MKQKRFDVEQIVAVMKQAEAGIPLAELIRRVGISKQTFYRWKSRNVDLEVDQVRQLKQPQEENTRLEQLGPSPVASNEIRLVFCRIHSWLTGRRLVSLPFSDHCEPLYDSEEELQFLARYLRSAFEHQDWKVWRFVSSTVLSLLWEMPRVFERRTNISSIELTCGRVWRMSSVPSIKIRFRDASAEQRGLV